MTSRRTTAKIVWLAVLTLVMGTLAVSLAWHVARFRYCRSLGAPIYYCLGQ